MSRRCLLPISGKLNQVSDCTRKEEEEDVVTDMTPSSPGAKELTLEVEDSDLDAFSSA